MYDFKYWEIQRNIIKSNRNQIVFIIFRLTWNQTDSVRLVPNQSENGKYNLISVWLNKISIRFLYVRVRARDRVLL